MGENDLTGRDFITNENRMNRYGAPDSRMGPRAQSVARLQEANAEINLEVILAALIAPSPLIAWFFTASRLLS